MEWGDTTLGEFLESVEAHNDTGQADKPEPASADFREFMKAKFKQG